MSEKGLDIQRIRDKLSFIRRQKQHLAALSNDVGELRRLMGDPFLSGAVKYSLQTGVEAVIDIAYHICAKLYAYAPNSAGDAIETLCRNGVLPEEQAAIFIPMVNFRNKLVHDYLEIEAGKIAEIVLANLDDFELWDQAMTQLILHHKLQKE